LLCFAALSGAAWPATARRPMVGFLPFAGQRGALAYAIPEFIYWELYAIPGLRGVDMDPMVAGIELDRLSVPKNWSDTRAYSRLAAATGVDYLVTGKVERQDESVVRFRVVVYSASDHRFFREHVHVCAVSGLVAEAVRAAMEIASDVGVPVASSIEFDTMKVDLKALRLLDESVRLYTGCERDQSDRREADRLAGKARERCSSSPMLSAWASPSSSYSTGGLPWYSRLRRRRSWNPFAQAAGRLRGRYTNDWQTRDQTPLPVHTATDGRSVWDLSSAWRTDLDIVGSHRMTRDSRAQTMRDNQAQTMRDSQAQMMRDSQAQMMRDSKALNSCFAALLARHPRSAYLRYCFGRYLLRAGKWAESTAECEEAIRINPESYRLRLQLVEGYIAASRNDEALAALKPVLKRWPNRSECHSLAAALYRDWRQYDKAAGEMVIVQRLDPGLDVRHEMLAEDYMRAGRVVEAARELARGDGRFRTTVVTASFVLVGVFLIGIIFMAILVRVLLGPG